MKKLILISGALATGKTTYSKILSNKYNLLLFNKDPVKEKLSDAIGFKDREENFKLSVGTFSVMAYFFDVVARKGEALILEANFHQNEIMILKDKALKYQYEVLNIILDGDEKILFERFSYRAHHENRHPCHLSGPVTASSFASYLQENRKVEYFGKTININANSFSYQNDEKIFKEIENFLEC